MGPRRNVSRVEEWWAWQRAWGRGPVVFGMTYLHNFPFTQGRNNLLAYYYNLNVS